MVRIPQQVSRRPVPTGRDRALRPFGGNPIAAGIRKVGQGLRRAEQQRDAAAVVEATANMRSEFAGRYVEAVQGAKPDGSGFAAGIQSQLDQYVAGVAESLPSDDARRLFAERAARFGGEIGARAEAFEVQAAGDHRALQLGRAIDATANAIRSDGSQYDDGRAELMASLDEAAKTLPADRMAALRSAAEQSLAQSAILFGIDEDPSAALDALDSGDFDDRLTPSQKNALMTRATSERDRLAREAAVRERLARTEYLGGFDDYVAFLEAGNAPDGRYSDDDLVANLGEEAAREMIEARGRAEAFGADLNMIALATPDEEAAMLAERRADLETPEDFRAEASEFGRLVNAIGEKRRQLGNDPAGYLRAQSPEIDDAYQEMVSARLAVVDAEDQEAALAVSRETSQRYANLTVAEQERLGVPAADTRILPAGAAASIVGEFRAAQGAGAALVLMSQSERFGEFWPRIVTELRDEGLPEVGLVIGSMTRRSQVEAAGRLAEIAATSTPDLRKVLHEDVAATIDHELPNVLADFRESLATVPGGQSVFSVFFEQTRRLAYDLARTDGSSAIEDAAAAIINDHYRFWEFRGRTVRIPVERDLDAIMMGAGLELNSIVGSVEFDVPPSLDPLLQSDQVPELYRQSLRDTAYWITNGDESGLVLFDSRQATVLDAEGRAIHRTWRELEERGRQVIEEMEALGTQASP